jgi:uncharacterized repeat protein (TIGR03803 family)
MPLRNLNKLSLLLRVLLLLGAVSLFISSLSAQDYSILYSFSGGADGAYPQASLIRDAAGNLYGTTYQGGSSGQGTAFKLDTSGHETVLHSFSGGPDGSQIFAGLIMDQAGNFYGTAYQGGASNAGIVFKLDPAGNETVLYTFTGGVDGGNPVAGLFRDTQGNLYGTTYQGGAFNAGTVYKLDSANNETVLYSFTGGNDGAHPVGSVIMDALGNLYGTTEFGGSGSVGVVFKLDTANNETVLHTFSGSFGPGSAAGLIMDAAGILYGTTVSTVFKIDTGGNYTLLHHFTGADGSQVYAGVIRDAAGNLYGTSFAGGASNNGTVFKLDPAGNLTLLHSFNNQGGDGYNPMGGLVLDPAGNLYGTTANGGSSDAGTVFAFLVDDDSNFALLNGNNTFNGNQTVNGSVAATTFSGDGSNLSNINPGAIGPGTANINISGNASTATTATTANLANSALNATNADNLGNVAATSYARLDIANIFSGEQTLAPSAADHASLNVPNTGVAPSNPTMGDLWLTTADAHFQFRDRNGVTQSLAFLSDVGGGGILQQAEQYTDMQVGAEKTRAQGAESLLSTAISAETTRAEAAEAGKANLSGGNSFSGDQSISGNESLTGNLAVGGSVSIGGGTAITKHMSAVFNPAFPSLRKGDCATASFSFNGVSDGDTMALGVPNTRMRAPGNFVFTAWASAANTVTIQGCNVGSSNQTTVGTGSIRVDVWKH